jgi:hypothetical protein
MTLADRLHYVLARHSPSKHVSSLTAMIMRLFELYKDQCYTNGKEFAEHESIAIGL